MFLDFWNPIGFGNAVLQWIVNGVPIRCIGSPPIQRVTRNSRLNFVASFLVNELLAAKTIIDVSVRPSLVSPLCVVPYLSPKTLR